MLRQNSEHCGRHTLVSEEKAAEIVGIAVGCGGDQVVMSEVGPGNFDVGSWSEYYLGHIWRTPTSTSAHAYPFRRNGGRYCQR